MFFHCIQPKVYSWIKKNAPKDQFSKNHFMRTDFFFIYYLHRLSIFNIKLGGLWNSIRRLIDFGHGFLWHWMTIHCPLAYLASVTNGMWHKIVKSIHKNTHYVKRSKVIVMDWHRVFRTNESVVGFEEVDQIQKMWSE